MIRQVSILAIMTALAACSSGSSNSSGGGTTTPINSAPTVDAGADQNVAEGTDVQLDATASDANGDTLSYSWTQTAGTTVALSSASVEDPSFTAPDVSADENLIFELTVSDGSVSTTDSVTITVTDVSLPDYASFFERESLDGEPEIVSCVVGGVTTNCMSITIKSSPGGNFTVGPFCPRLTTDTAEEGGIWFTSTDQMTVYDVDGNFITNLSSVYDASWQMFDPNTNEVFYTENEEECRLAANPNPSAELFNHCVECLVEYLDEGLSQTVLIPLEPVDASTVNARSAKGVAFSGVVFDQSAPINIIENNNNIAPFDDCGGHINPDVGYHFHAVTDGCLIEIENDRGHASQIGVALDGYPIFERLNGTSEPTDLDQCRGHDSDVATYNLDVGYHYHVDEPASNAILPCLSGEIAR